MDKNDEVYTSLSTPRNEKKKQKLTLYLISCCIVACIASFIFGYNIGVMNLPQPLINDFYSKKYFARYYDGVKQIENASDLLETGKTRLLIAVHKKLDVNHTIESLEKYLKEEKERLEDMFEPLLGPLEKGLEGLQEKIKLFNEKKKLLDEGAVKVKKAQSLLWVATTAVFVIGGLIGTSTSKIVSEKLGRKNGIVFHYSFAVIASILCLIAPYIDSPECIIISRFLFGIQGGMACGLIPTYLHEISPSEKRGSTGVMNQLLLTIGIAVSQVLGFRQLLGTPGFWHILLGLPLVISVLGGVLLFVVFPETPSSLIRKYNNTDAAKNALRKLRNSKNVDDEIENITAEIRKDSNSSQSSISIVQLFKGSQYKWPLITGLTLQLAQQLCGINAIFFYSGIIYKDAGIIDEYIQYAVVATGLINVVATILSYLLIDKLGRKPLLQYPLLIMVFDFIGLTLCLVFKDYHYIISYLSIVCIIIFIILFAVGLGPIPFVYVAEVFPSEARSTALAICMFTNWMANLLLTMTFVYINNFLKEYTFLVFTGIVAVAAAFVFKKVPETKGKTPEEILKKMDPKFRTQFEESSKRLMQK